MPGISTLKPIGHLKMASHMLKLPTADGWKQPQGDPGAKQFADCIKPEDRVAIPTEIPPVFMPQCANKFHQETCDKIGKELKKFHDDMLSAVEYALMMWKTSSKFKDFVVMAVSAIGSPGCLDGPELESNIKNAPMVSSMSGNAAKWRDAVAKGVSKCFKDWQGQVMVPGLPLYPLFAFFPGPMAPPTPNVPVPLIACPSPMMTAIILPNTMASEMESALDGGIKDKDPDGQYKACFDGIATVLAIAFPLWLPQQMVNLVLGKGQIPTFAPPFVPGGPVMGGDNVAAPGHMIA